MASDASRKPRSLVRTTWRMDGSSCKTKAYPQKTSCWASLPAALPFVLSILKHCKAEGIPTGCIVNNPHSPIAEQADNPVEVITGPEFVTGSTRMKAGSSQKMILDMISTSLQIRQGRVEGNKMVNAKLINHKLIDRACRIFIERHPEYADKYEEVKQMILKAGSVKKAEKLLGQQR